MEILSPAKVNLYLRVLSRKKDGYHEIETLFERVSLFDRIFIEKSASTSIRCDSPGVPTGQGSLLWNTVDLFHRISPKPRFGVDIHIQKNIPVAAGLGGGSSNAASVLIAMNRLCDSPLTREQLVRAGAGLGADIPFFLFQTAFALGRGIGDVLEKVDMPFDLDHVIINPPFGISTAEVYSETGPFSLTKKNGIDTMLYSFSDLKGAGQLCEKLRNDLQTVVLRKYPQLAKIIECLVERGALAAQITGSGPTVFGVFERGEAETALNALRGDLPAKQGWVICPARTWREQI